MSRTSKCSNILSYFWGIALICASIILLVYQPHDKFIRTAVQTESELIEGRQLYESIWLKLDLYFRIYLFDVRNPDEVMKGAKPQFQERGPYVYDMLVEKEVLKIDEDMDELEYLTTRTYHFNKLLSNGSEDDEVTIIHPVYMATMGKMAAAFSSFLKKLGNDIPKLFPGMIDIFVRGKVGDITFHGLPMECDVEKYKELKLICGFLMGNKPPIIRDTDTEGVYKWSFFERLNGTAQGPFSVNRGVKNKSLLGDTTSLEGKRVQKIWHSDECNKVLGTDSITWPPMNKDLDYVRSYEPQICRWVKTNFKKKVVLQNLIGLRYQLDDESWQPEHVKCYCPLVKKQPVCPPTGLMDLTPCQPHFLHGDPSLLDWAVGLNPIEDKHAARITIEPLSGIPLSGSKNLQLNVKLFNSPGVAFLANVSDGFFPIIWVEEAKDADMESLGSMLQIMRLQRLFCYMVYVPLVVGIFLVIRAFYVHSNVGSSAKSEESETVNSVLVGNRPRINNSETTVIRRTRAFINRP